MDPKHYRSLQSLSIYCYFCGLFPTLFGILISFNDFIHQDYLHMQIGVFMFITGYAEVKISYLLDDILKAERERIEVASKT